MTRLSILGLALCALAARAAPLLDKRCVVDPNITFPSGGESFAAGATLNVTWSTDFPNCAISNKASVQLIQCLDGYTAGQPASCTSRHLYTPTLASNFSLSDGKVNVTLPSNLTAGTNYQIILFGDSGNLSNEFSVTAAAANGTGSLDQVLAELGLKEKIWGHPGA